MSWRPMTPADFPDVAAIADEVHPAFPEDASICAERQRLYPRGAWLWQREGKAEGYLLAHPWRSNRAPALNTLLHRLPEDPDIFYIHDLAMLPGARGSGAARLIVEQMAAQARAAGFPAIGLIAVNGSVPVWRRLGFAVVDGAIPADKLASYEAEARYMVRRLEGATG